MKKLLILVAVMCMLVPVVQAEDAYFKLGQLELTVPIKDNLDVVTLYDIWNGVGLAGAESQLAQYGKYYLNFGAVSSYLGQGTPYLSLDYDFGVTDPKLANLGIWVGFDFNEGDYRSGLKASVPLW